MEEKKEGKGTCYKRMSKNGNPYYNGKFELDGKLYWLKLFSTKTMDGQQAISFIIDPRLPMNNEQPKEVDPGWTTPPNGFDPVKNEFTDTVDDL